MTREGSTSAVSLKEKSTGKVHLKKLCHFFIFSFFLQKDSMKVAEEVLQIVQWNETSFWFRKKLETQQGILLQEL